MNKYEMHVYCRRSGVSRDGGLHATEHANSLEEVLPIFQREGQWLLQMYDTVQVSIICDGEKVHGYSLRKPNDSRTSPHPYSGTR